MAMKAADETIRANEDLTAQLLRGLVERPVEDETSKEFELERQIEALKREYREYGG